MVVYLVIHNDGDYESSNEVRGCFATRELAEQVVTLDETGVYPATFSSRERFWRRSHDADCCEVEETVVATTLPEPFVLNPERPFRLSAEEHFVPRTWVYDAIENLQRGR